MPLTPERLAEFVQACSVRRHDDAGYERLRGMLGEAVDELAVIGGKIGPWAHRELLRADPFDKDKLDTLRHQRSYGEMLVREACGRWRG